MREDAVAHGAGNPLLLLQDPARELPHPIGFSGSLVISIRCGRSFTERHGTSRLRPPAGNANHLRGQSLLYLLFHPFERHLTISVNIALTA